MRDKHKTREQLTKELAELRQRIAELERAEIERKRETLRGSEEELREIIDSVNDGIVLLDVTGKVTSINKRVTEVAGYTAEDIVGKRLTLLKKMFPPKSLATMFAPFTQVISGRQPPPYEVEVYAKTGEKLFVEIHGSLLMKGGEKTGVVAVLRDITERKRLESLLLREREIFVTILQHALYGVVLLDRDGKHVYVNPAFTAITGYTLEDIPTSRDWTHKAYPDEAYRQKVTALWKKDKRLGVAKRVISVVCKNGETREIEFGPTVLEDGRAVVMLADITERKRAEEELQRYREHLEELVTERTAALQAANEQLQREIAERKGIEEKLQRAYGELKESEERYHTLVDNIDLGINRIDSDYTISMVNATLSRGVQKTASELIGKKCFREFEHRDAVCPHCPGVQTMATGEPTAVEVEVVRDDGYRNHVRLHAFPVFGHDGTVTGFIEVTEEITERKQMEEELRERQKELQTLMDASPIAISWADFQGNIQYINRKHHELFGYALEEIPTIAEWQRRADQDQVQREEFNLWLNEIMEAHKHGTLLPPRGMTVTCKDGSSRYVTVEGTVVFNRTLVIYNDITERKQMEENLRESEERFRLLVEHSKDAFVLHDFDGKIIDVNQHACDSLGYTREELLGLSVQDIDQNVIAGKHKEKWNQMILGEPINLEGIHRRKDGTTFPVEIRLGVLESGGRRLMLGLVRDITERVRVEETIRKMAYHDALTGLPNRVLFVDRLNRAMAQVHRKQKKLAVMLLDLDHFKDINDTLGHTVGDQLLSSVGKRLTGLLRKEDTVSRMGGDEFFLLLPEVDWVQDAATIAQKVLKAIQEPFVLDVHEINITTSIGIAMYPDEGADVKTLLKNADVALYQAKEKGRNNYQHYTVAMDPCFQGDG
jgi:diguanylate cyclase (GGDEF)-like protein/PAS domain S-box-containing protein